ncbi:MAG TPA: hypothetical protein VM871_00210 [Flavisolibacter sp.]|jgi:uncharacterized membrane protein|nr:hypothetical protein [Flavisolibacter sp.]
MNRKLTTLLYACFCFLLLSCSKGNGTNNGNNGGGGSTGGTTQGPMFIAVKGVLQSNCAVSGCHAGTSPQNGINFSDDNTIVAQKARIKVRAVDNAGTANQMPPPPAAPLSTADQQKITAWINAGGNISN